ncbi:MAG: DUF1697 domain-containing protein [Cyclobacteriaceae bacterium]
MTTYISLLRGINVSGQKKVPMADLRDVYASLGFDPVQTYIQSGNVLFQSEETDLVLLREQLEEAIRQFFGFEVVVILRTVDALQQQVKHPFFVLRSETIKALYVTFLAEMPDPKRIAELVSPNPEGDEFQIVDKAVHLYCPNGYGRTKLSNTFFERKLKVSATTRNAKTIHKLLELAANFS